MPGRLAPKGDTGPQGPSGDTTALQATINALQTQSNALQDQSSMLQTQINTLQTQSNALQTQSNALQARVTTIEGNAALLLGPYVQVVPDALDGLAGPHVLFVGANVHIRSGAGATDDGGTPTGRGNLVVGYNEPGTEMQPGDRLASHSLIIGPYHSYTHAGGLVAGYGNKVGNAYASVSGGVNNDATGVGASVSGGYKNVASSDQASVSGGTENTASGVGASVSGGAFNSAGGMQSSVSGGYQHSAPGEYDWAAAALFYDY